MEHLQQTKNRIPDTKKEGIADEWKKELEVTKKELEYAMEHMEDELSLQEIDRLLKKLEYLQPITHEFETDAEKDVFFQRYLPMAEKMPESVHSTKISVKQKPIKWKKAVKTAIAFATVLLCLNGATMVFAEMSLFETIFTWNTETFQIHTKKVNPTASDATEKVRKQAEKDMGISIPQIGYFMGMKTERAEGFPNDMIVLQYSDGNQIYHYTIEILNTSEQNIFIEKTNTKPLVVTHNGISYYIVENKNWVSIIWEHNHLSYTITGPIDRKQADKIIKSIIYDEEV